MKKISILIAICCLSMGLPAQIIKEPAHWAYGLKKMAGNTYEVHLQCTIDTPWHIYARKQGKSFIGTATRIFFTKQPGLTLVGLPIEKGRKDIYKDPEVGIVNFEYAGKVDFVQQVTIKPGVKEIRGRVIYQTCTHEHCLPQTSLEFTIPVP